MGDRQPSRRHQPGDAVDDAHLERLIGRQLGQDAGKAAGQHGLARTGRPDQQAVVAAGRRDLQRPSGHPLPRHIGEVRRAGDCSGCATPPVGRGQARPAFQPVCEGGQRFHGQGLDTLDPRGFGTVGAGDYYAAPPRGPRCQDHGEDAIHLFDPTIQRQFPDQHPIAQAFQTYLARGGKNCDRNGQVEARSLLAEAGRSQVHGDAPQGELQAGIADGSPYPFARLAQRAIGQSHQVEGGHARADVHLDFHQPGLNAYQGTSERLGKQVDSLLGW